MTELECPYCGGIVELPPYCSTVVCPYCNTTIRTKTGTIFKEHYMMDIQYSLQDAQEKMFEWAMKQLGAPEDLKQAEIVDSNLTFWPFWVVEIEANAAYSGSQKKPKFPRNEALSIHKVEWEVEHEEGTIDLADDFFIPANREMPKSLMNYNIPIKRKDFFDQEKISDQGGMREEIQVDQDEALTIARSSMVGSLRQEAKIEIEEIVQLDHDLKITAIFLIEIPIWHIEYSYNGERYNAFVDGASGRVVSLNFPRKESYRAQTQLIGHLHLGIGGAISLLLIYLGLTQFDGVFPTYFGLALGFEMIIFSLLFSREARSLGTGEEGEK